MYTNERVTNQPYLSPSGYLHLIQSTKSLVQLFAIKHIHKKSSIMNKYSVHTCTYCTENIPHPYIILGKYTCTL